MPLDKVTRFSPHTELGFTRSPSAVSPLKSLPNSREPNSFRNELNEGLQFPAYTTVYGGLGSALGGGSSIGFGGGSSVGVGGAIGVPGLTGGGITGGFGFGGASGTFGLSAFRSVCEVSDVSLESHRNSVHAGSSDLAAQRSSRTGSDLVSISASLTDVTDVFTPVVYCICRSRTALCFFPQLYSAIPVAVILSRANYQQLRRLRHHFPLRSR